MIKIISCKKNGSAYFAAGIRSSLPMSTGAAGNIKLDLHSLYFQNETSVYIVIDS